MKNKIYTLVLAASFLSVSDVVNAQTWSPKHAGLPSAFGAKTVYGAGNSIIVTNTSGTVGSQVYYTTDTSSPFMASASSLGLYAPMESNIVKCANMLFAGSTVGLYKSHDNGQTWASASSSAGAVYGLYASNDTLFASLGGVVEMSTDTGTTWVSLNYTGALAVSIYSAGGILYVGSISSLSYTADMGANWTTVSSPSSLGGQPIAAITGLGSAVYAANGNGIFKSLDNGHSWTNVLAQTMFCLTVVDTSLLGGTATHGIYQSDASGANWNQVNTGLPPSGGLYDAVSYISYNDDYLIASTQSDSEIYVTSLSGLGLVSSGPTTKIRPVSKEEIDFTIFPNPAADELFINTSDKEASGAVTIFDISGRCVTRQNFNNTGSARIDLRGVLPGMYQVQVRVGDARMAKMLSVVK